MVANVHTKTTPEEIQAQQIERKNKDTAITKISKYLESETVFSRFAKVVGDRNAASYIASVMITVKDSYQLQECHPESIYTSALRAATLKLSTDPATGQAYLVPYAGKCTLQIGYKGLYDMAVRTGKYRYINVGPIYEGQTVQENQITGFHSISGSKQGDTIIGWIGAFEMNPERGQVTGFGKTFYMTIIEIHAHAKQYSKTYGKKDKKGNPTIWQVETPKMERKTVLRLMLRRWGYFDPNDVQMLNEVEAEDETIEGAASDIYNPEMPTIPDYDEDAETHKRTTEENVSQLGYS
jgi:recombination protein RecT